MLLLSLAAASLAAAPRIASYDIRVELDPATHRLHGSERISWTNTTATAPSELRFHLYLNAFAGDDTTFFRESEGRHRRFRATAEGWGWMHIGRMAIAGGPDVTARLRFASPDDGNGADRTVAMLPLDAPVPPGGTISLDVEFDAQLPRVFARTGYAGDFHLIGQWFPKLGVFEAPGGGEARWNCHQFHANSEFYADFGDYHVAITVPVGWVVGSSGHEVSRTTKAGKLTMSLEQEAVHDFAMVAAPDLADIKATFTDADVPRPWRLEATHLLGRRPETLRLPDVALRLLVPHRLAPLAPRILAGAKAAIAHYGLFYGPYPYPTLTMVVPPEDSEGAGGMEYPTFITLGGTWKDLLPPRKWRQEPELVTIHEFGHQYFYGLLATNEFEHAWMDEGFNTYGEFRTRELFRRDVAPVPARLPAVLFMPLWLGARVFLGYLPAGEPIETPAWGFRGAPEYFLRSYDHTALVLATCENLAGRAAFARGMRAYGERFRFRHPTPGDFFATMAEFVPAEAASFLRQAITRSLPCDFAIEEAHSRRWRAPEGTLAPEPGGKGEPPARAAASKPPKWENEVLVTRPGELVIPVDIELDYADGTVQRLVWDGKKRFDRIATKTTSRLVLAKVDPEGKLLVESNRVNNVMAVNPGGPQRAKANLDLLALVSALLTTAGAWL